MYLDLGFLGDTVHSMPALWMVRQAYPDAELHCVVSEHITPLLECLPWVDQAWGYPRFPKHATLRQNLRFLARLRREKFDVLINLNKSDRSGWLTFFSGARERLGWTTRRWFWRQRFTQCVSHAVSRELIYIQKCRCLEKAGFPFTQPEFHVQIDPNHLQKAGIATADVRTYFHLSPFTTDDRKELPLAQLVEFITGLQERWPDKELVLSGAPSDRERGKMASLLQQLPRPPWRVFAGELSLLQLAAVIQHSALHLCGDTGTLHLGLMTGTPTVSWFRPNPKTEMWIPTGDRHRTVFGTGNDPHARLQGIDTRKLLEAMEAVLRTSGPANVS